MVAHATGSTSAAIRPPRAMAWVVLLASAGAVLLIGLLATAIVIINQGAWPQPRWTFWARLLAAGFLTILSLGLRSLRWIFLLRRAETRIPIRDACIGYFAGLALLFAPLLIGEIAVRAWILRARGRVPVVATSIVNLADRAFDLLALAVIALVTRRAWSSPSPWTMAAAVGVALSAVAPARRAGLAAALSILSRIARDIEAPRPNKYQALARASTWTTALAASVIAWTLPGIALWLLAAEWNPVFTVGQGEAIYVRASLLSGLLLAPGGVVVAGSSLLQALESSGIAGGAAVLTVFTLRAATVGVSVALGALFLLIHLRSGAAVSATHFDDIADAYDVQIPEARREALLEIKTDMMRDILERRGIGRRGLDVGCGQGAYVARMRTLGFDVDGIDASAGQVRLAARRVGEGSVITRGSVLDIPAPDATFDFVYVINVLHHLASIEEQRRAFGELLRVLRPGGVIFVHEINTRNVLFRFYMGYIFPSLNCIDEGVERWLLPHRLDHYTPAVLVEARFFTFLPDFAPRPIVALFRPLERMLESSPLRVYSAHYMAVLQKAR